MSQREILKKNIGQEPVVNSDILLEKSELTKVINWYYYNTSIDEQRTYISTYIKKYDMLDLPIDVSLYSKYNAYSIIARLNVLGWNLPEIYNTNLIKFISSLHKKKGCVEEEVKKPVVAVADKNIFLSEIDYYIDDHYFNNLNTPFKFETTLANIKVSIEYLEDLLFHLEDDYKHKGYTYEGYKKLKSIIKNLLDSYLELQKNTTTKKVVVRKVNKNTMTKSVKYKIPTKEDILHFKKLLTPADIVEKKKVYLYDTSKKTLLVYYSMEGFMFSGTTLKNFTDKSYSVRIKDINTIENFTITSLNKIMTDSKTKKILTSGRFNENLIILCVS